MLSRSLSLLPFKLDTRAALNRAWLALLLAVPLSIAVVGMVNAGGAAIGWADAVGVFSDEATAMGALAVIIAIAAVGAVLMFGITGLITTVVMACLGGALMANADAVAGAIFGAGGGGGSVLMVVLPQ